MNSNNCYKIEKYLDNKTVVKVRCFRYSVELDLSNGVTVLFHANSTPTFKHNDQLVTLDYLLKEEK